MKEKKIRIIIIVLLILLIILLAIIFKIIQLINIDKNPNKTQENITVENETSISDYDKNVYYEENGVIYSTSGEPKDGIDFELEGIPDEVFNQYIKDKKSFYATIETYAFSYGFYKKANIATYNRYENEQKTNRLAIEFVLNDTDKTKCIAIVNLNENTIEILE